ncbi:unnamed protein product [Trichobilharzia szidati]|nr:unnamed protein product [Trichobilharzia szidati]
MNSHNYNHQREQQRQQEQQTNVNPVTDLTNYQIKKRSRKKSDEFESRQEEGGDGDKGGEGGDGEKSPQQIFQQYQNQQVDDTTMNCSHAGSSHMEQRDETALSMKSATMSMGNSPDQFVCPVCRNEIQSEDLEDHYSYELKQIQNFTISVPTEEMIKMSSKRELSPPTIISQQTNEALQNSESRFAIFKNIEKNRKERREKFLEHLYSLNDRNDNREKRKQPQVIPKFYNVTK